MVLRLRPEARLDLEAAARWYEAQEPGLGRRFLEEVRQAFQRIQSNPEAYTLPLRRDRPARSQTRHDRCAVRSALRPRPKALASALQLVSPLPQQDVVHRIRYSWWARFTFNGITRCERGSYAHVGGVAEGLCAAIEPCGAKRDQESVKVRLLLLPGVEQCIYSAFIAILVMPHSADESPPRTIR